ncbi:MAG: hypothetical protein GAK28_03494 [Luteibacter sp.]|uniref:DUF418 domain-containing protein n=1 Tax=Luteibacter sp. TaxID=1886636 RepID=UPI00137CD4FC|nr:DUF418 domain-containing protein [Luteibacter sp.]KAF1005242.1 MAG: hypothetical protein GAK28_03494 [Luteibacter sp.]
MPACFARWYRFDMSSITAQAASTKPKLRIQSLDLIRGIAILGILAVNADGYAVPISASLKPESWPFPNEGLTAFSYWFMDAFFHEKFVTLFSMLFGVSLFLVGGERNDPVRGRLLRRRLITLFFFAMLHGFGIWWGDILSLYAVTGCIMFFCRSWKPRTLMTVGLALFLAMSVREFPDLYPHPAQATASVTPEHAANMQAEHRARIAAQIDDARSSWEGAYRANTQAYLKLLRGDIDLVPSTLALMMIGLALFKYGFFAGAWPDRRYRVLVVVGALALALVCWLTWQQDILASPVVGGHFLQLIVSPWAALGYAAGLILLIRAGAARLLSPIAAAGRMAFTNYLTQSLIMTSIFYGGRGGWMGQVDRPVLWAIVVGVWCLQLIWSPLWMSRFDMGPFEWVWRCFTYGRRVPIRTPR